MRLNEKSALPERVEKTQKILEAGGFRKAIRKGGLVGVKQHFGEEGNEGFIRPEISRAVGDFVKKSGGRPLLVETNTLYRGRRSNSCDHLLLAHEHGFSVERTGMPVAILDGICGQNQHPVEIPGKHFQTLFMVSDLPFFDSLVVLTHVKGHMAAGLGGTVKNLSMGFASRAGKLAQHADFRPEINDKKCIRCELCGQFCPADALALEDGNMEVSYEKCIGCGECHAVCRTGAIKFQFQKSDHAFQERMAEYALGAVIHHKDAAVYINHLNCISRQCDCWGDTNPPVFPDVGIFVSLDPVAVDQACVDTGTQILGEDPFRKMWPEIDPTVQLRHGEAIGLGSRKYDLIEVEE